MKKNVFTTFLCIGAISMIVMSTNYFQSNDAGILERKEIADNLWYLFSFRTHIFFGLVSISVGPVQFIKKLRNRYKYAHKVVGYVYSVSILFSSLTGLIIAQFSMGGWITAIGFSVLSMVWFFTTAMAIKTIRFGDVLNHKKWMFLSYGVTFSAITQRTLLLIPLITEVPFMPIYQLSSWLPWLLNSSIAYYLFKRSVRIHRLANSKKPVGNIV